MMYKLIIAIFCIVFKFAFIANGLCCRDEGVSLGLFCRCRQSCAGSGCISGYNAECGNGVCCCGDSGACTKPEEPELDDCLTEDPTNDPSNDPTINPSRDPTSVPTNNPTIEPTLNPVVVCDIWMPDTSVPTSVGGDGNEPPIPDPDSPQLCQLGRSGDYNELDKYYAWSCSCFDAQTLFKLTQLIHVWFEEFNINFKQGEEGRFEQWYENYASNDIYFQTSFNASPTMPGRQWTDLESLTSCDPNNPGYGEFMREIAQTLEFEDIPGGVLMKRCLDNGNTAIAQIKSDTYRVRSNGVTEIIAAIGNFILVKEDGTNIWLIKEITFVGRTVGFISQNEP